MRITSKNFGCLSQWKSSRKVILILLMVVAMGWPIAVKGKSYQRVLVAYYSKTGNTQKMAECIAKYTGGDLLRIEPAVAYPDDQEKFVTRAKTECHENMKIELKMRDVNIEEYDVVFIGSPVWFSDWAAPASSFAKDPRLEGKRVIPFMTAGRENDDVPDLLYKKYSKATPERGLCLVHDKLGHGGEEVILEWVCGLFDMKCCGELTVMNVETSLRAMKCRYPKITLCDVYKSFYQDYFGAGHIISDKKKAMNYIKEELKTVNKISVGVEMNCRAMRSEATGFEDCGAIGRYVRVDLWKIKNGEIDIKDYVSMLMQSVEEKIDTAGWLKEWNFILYVIQESHIKIDNYDKDLQLINSRIAAGEYGMHHSKVFNECYHPHYRIIKREIIKY